MIRVAIIGAGMAGLACARRLAQAGVQPVLFDKGRAAGGRVSTRRSDGLQFDHGAQYVTAQGPGFAAVLRELAATGDAAAWLEGSGRARVVGTPDMATLGKAMASGLDVRQGFHVSAIRPADGGWQVLAGDAGLRAARVVITVPAPQVAGLLGAEHPWAARLGAVRMDPCLTLMAGIAAPAPFVTRAAPDDALAWIAQDSAKPGRPTAEVVTWVAQAGPTFSAAHVDDEPAALVARMLPMLCERLGVTSDRVRHATAHRWRYAQVAAPLGVPFLRDAGGSLYLGGDWCLGRRVEDAWTSGTAMADDLLSHALLAQLR